MKQINGIRDFHIFNEKLKNDQLENFFDDQSGIYRVYGYANDHLSEYYAKINFRDKKMLTVLSSGDHYLEPIRQGMSKSNISTFDINRLTIYCTYMKILALLTNHRRDFLWGGLQTTPEPLIVSQDNFRSMGYHLPKEIKAFWTLFYENNLDSVNPEHYLEYSHVLPEMIPYLANDDNYYDLAEYFYSDIPKIPFYNQNILNLPLTFTPGAFDILSISNIFDYVPVTEEGFIKLISILSDHGLLICKSGENDKALNFKALADQHLNGIRETTIGTKKLLQYQKRS